MIALSIQGISPVLPLFVLAVMALLSIAIAWWSYHHLSSIPAGKKVALITLRSAAFFLLSLLLLNPFYVWEETEEQRPRLAVYLDNSQSVSIERGDYEGLDTYQQRIDAFREQLSDEYDLEWFLFGGSTEPGEQPQAVEPVTNLEQVIRHMSQQRGQTVASLLWSDGIATQGRDPVFSAQNAPFPIFTVPLGDTSAVRDVRIASLTYNNISYVQTRDRIAVEVQQDGYLDARADIQLLENGTVLESRSVRFAEESSNHEVIFEIEHTEEGLREFEVHIPALPDEFNEQNNTERFTVDVLDDKRIVWSLAFEVHPDIGAIRRFVAADQQTELFQYDEFGPDRYHGDDPMASDEQPDLLILHGLPPEHSRVSSWIEDQNSSKVLFLLPSSLDAARTSERPEWVPINPRTVGGMLNVHLSLSQELYTHPILELPQAAFRTYPTVRAFRGNYSLSSLATVLFSAEFQRSETGIPLLAVEESLDTRTVYVHGFGWNTWARSANEDVRNWYQQFFGNLFSWVSTSPQNRNLSIEPVKDRFAESEIVRIQGTLINERGEPETDAIVEISVLSSSTGEEQTYRLRHTGNGRYDVQLGSFPEGVYTIDAIAQKGDRTLGRADSRFEVSQATREFADTRRDDRVLRQIAERSGGNFIENADFEELFTSLRNAGLHQPIVDVRSETRFLYDIPFWFLIVVGLLTAEWILRRTSSLP
ncbi:MAG: hypothetical protein ACNA78_01860 [Balneolaceae bacterium]